MTSTPRSWAVIPVKFLERAKSRLAPVLDARERRVLVTLMLQDVLNQAITCSQVERVIVVTADVAVAFMLRKWPVDLLNEPLPCGHSQAVRYACSYLAAAGVKKGLVLAADIPTVHASEITALIRIGVRSPSVTVAVDRHGTGSNALALSPPDAIHPRFGVDSLRLHCDAASQRGAPAMTLQLPGIGFDIDEPVDLALLAAFGSSCRSSEFVNSAGIADRVRRYLAARTCAGVGE